MSRIYPSIADALNCIQDGMVVMIGGFGGAGAPIELIHALVDRYKATGSPGNLTIVNNNAGNGDVGIAAMIDAGMARHDAIEIEERSSTDPHAYEAGATPISPAKIAAIELVPQVTPSAEHIRAYR